MYFEDRHIDTLSFISDVYRDDISIEGGCLRDECASLYHPPDAVLPREELANLWPDCCQGARSFGVIRELAPDADKLGGS